MSWHLRQAEAIEGQQRSPNQNPESSVPGAAAHVGRFLPPKQAPYPSALRVEADAVRPVLLDARPRLTPFPASSLFPGKGGFWHVGARFGTNRHPKRILRAASLLSLTNTRPSRFTGGRRRLRQGRCGPSGARLHTVQPVIT